MKSSNELFLLIKSMNRNEKGYFKKFASINSKKGDGNYLRLFDCMDGMNDYNEAAIRKKFAGEKFLTQLNVTKLYLQKMITKSLRNYYGDNDPDIERLNGMIEAALLVKKQLYDSALRVTAKLKESASDYEAHLNTLYLMQLEYQVHLRKGLYKEILTTGKEKFKKEERLLAEYHNLCEYRFLQGWVMSVTQIEGHTRNESVKEIKRMLAHPLLVDESQAKSFKAKMHRFEILNKCYLKTGQAEKAFNNAQEMVALFRNHPKHARLLPYNYFASLNGLINRCLAVGRFDTALTYIQEAEQLAIKPKSALSDSQKFEINIQTNEKRLIVYFKTGDYEKGIDAEKRLKAISKDRPVRTEMAVTIHYFSAACYLGSYKIKEALDRINKLIQGDYDDIRKDIVLCGHWMNFIIHFELGNYSILKRVLTVARNFIKKQGFPIEDCDIFIDLLQDIAKAAISGNPRLIRQKMLALQPRLATFDFIDEDVIQWWLQEKIK